MERTGVGYVFIPHWRFSGALMQYETVLRFQQIITPPREFPDAYLFRGAIRTARQEFSQAINDYDRSIEIYNRQIASLNAQAEISDSTGLKQKAEIDRRHKGDIEKQLRMALGLKTNAEKQMQQQRFVATSESSLLGSVKSVCVTQHIRIAENQLPRN